MGAERSFGVVELRRVHQLEPASIATVACLQTEMRKGPAAFASQAFTSAVAASPSAQRCPGSHHRGRQSLHLHRYHH